MDRWAGKVAVVTGASSGIGAAICTSLVEAGMQVVGLARRKHLIDELAQKLSERNSPGKLYGMCVDLTKDEEICAAFKTIEKNFRCVHVLVNNAGYLPNNHVLDGKSAVWKETFDLNVLGLLVATREAIALMKKNDFDGHIVHVNSVAGHNRMTRFQHLGVYPATKHAVTTIATQLRFELANAGRNVRVTSLSPGVVDTAMANGLKVTMDEESFKKLPMLRSEDVAAAVCYVLSVPQSVCITELTVQATGEKI